MERFVKGDIVVVRFPYSDLTSIKKRPAMIVKSIAGNDYLLTQITSKSYEKSEEVRIENVDFIEGNLKRISFVRFTKLFTADS